MNIFKSLRHRPFALLWMGQAISRFGDSLYQIALAWLVLEKTGSAAQMGAVMLFSRAPMVIFLLIGGVLVDRWPRLRVMMASDILSGIVILTIAFLDYSRNLEIWHLYAASFIFGFVEAFFFPAYSAAVPEITPHEMLPSANSLTELSKQLMGIIGPSVGALTVAFGTTALAFVLDACSFFVSALCVFLIQRAPSGYLGEVRRQHVLADLREGFSVVFASSWLWVTILIFAFVNLAGGGPFTVVLPMLIKKNLQADVGALGFVQTLFAVGWVGGALWLGRLTRFRHRGLISYSATILAGMGCLAIGLPITLYGVCLASFLRGLGFSIFSLIWINTLQELVPREKLGRVFSIDALGSFVLLPLGYAGIGMMADRWGAPMMFILGGGITIFLALAGLLHPAIRNLD